MCLSPSAAGKKGAFMIRTAVSALALAAALAVGVAIARQPEPLSPRRSPPRRRLTPSR
jgi:hypothetical protein